MIPLFFLAAPSLYKPISKLCILFSLFFICAVSGPSFLYKRGKYFCGRIYSTVSSAINMMLASSNKLANIEYFRSESDWTHLVSMLE